MYKFSFKCTFEPHFLTITEYVSRGTQ
uniref:Uncharacterized protein n=1 Tax=Anguilla anguilla TaxID=7936 RepID=A0A0E9XF04_ANGAN